MAYKIKSQESLLNLATFYCSKRETSRAWLGKYLQRKCHEQKIDKQIYAPWILAVLDTCEEKKMLDDRRYGDMLVREYTRIGKGKRYIEQKLNEKGIHKDLWEIPDDENTEFLRAVALGQKIIGSLTSKVARKAQRQSTKPKSKYQRPTNEKNELKQKMIQKLITSGFSIDISRKAVDQAMATLTGTN